MEQDETEKYSKRRHQHMQREKNKRAEHVQEASGMLYKKYTLAVVWWGEER